MKRDTKRSVARDEKPRLAPKGDRFEEWLSIPTDPRELPGWVMAIEFIINEIAIRDASEFQCPASKSVTEALAVRSRPTASFVDGGHGAVPIELVQGALMEMARLFHPHLIRSLREMRKGPEGGVPLEQHIYKELARGLALSRVEKAVSTGMKRNAAQKAVGRHLEASGQVEGSGECFVKNAAKRKKSLGRVLYPT